MQYIKIRLIKRGDRDKMDARLEMLNKKEYYGILSNMEWFELEELMDSEDVPVEEDGVILLTDIDNSGIFSLFNAETVRNLKGMISKRHELSCLFEKAQGENELWAIANKISPIDTALHALKITY